MYLCFIQSFEASLQIGVMSMRPTSLERGLVLNKIDINTSHGKQNNVYFSSTQLNFAD